MFLSPSDRYRQPRDLDQSDVEADGERMRDIYEGRQLRCEHGEVVDRHHWEECGAVAVGVILYYEPAASDFEGSAWIASCADHAPEDMHELRSTLSSDAAIWTIELGTQEGVHRRQ